MDRGEITIKVRATEDYVPARSVLKIVQNTLAAFKSLEHSIAGHDGESSEWKISGASLQSPLSLTISSDSEKSEQVVRAYMDGIEKIDKSDQPIAKEFFPQYFDKSILRDIKDMVSVLDYGVAQFSFRAPHSGTITPTQRIAATVDYFLSAAYTDYGTFEGRLETLSVHGKTRFTIFDVLTGEGISCFFSEEKLEEAQNAFNKRVLVSGMAKYSRLGDPISIKVEEIKIFKDRDKLPQAKDLKGINITEGVDSVRYIRGMRDAQ